MHRKPSVFVVDSQYNPIVSHRTGIGARIIAIIDMILALLYITFAIYTYESGSSYDAIISSIPMGGQRNDKKETRTVLLTIDCFWGILRFLIGLLLFQGAFRQSYKVVEAWLIITIIFFILCLGLFAFFLYVMVSLSERHGLWILAISVYFIYKIFSILIAMRLLEKLSVLKRAIINHALPNGPTALIYADNSPGSSSGGNHVEFSKIVKDSMPEVDAS